MKLFRKTFQQTTNASVAVFISTFFLCSTSQSILANFSRLDRFPTPKQINLSDPKVRASYTEEIQEKVMPLVSARTGQNYTLLSLEDYWNLIPGNFGSNQYNATLTASFSSQQPSTSVTIKMVYSEYYSGTKFNYHLDNLNVTNVKA